MASKLQELKSQPGYDSDPGHPADQEARKSMKEDNDLPKVVYLNKYKKRKKINWSCVTEANPWDWKNTWPPSKDEDLTEKESKEKR